jgi:hypothetical protein
VDGQQPSEEARAAARRIIEMEFWNGRYKLLIFGTYIGVSYPSNKGGHDGADHYRVPLARAFDEFSNNRERAQQEYILQLHQEINSLNERCQQQAKYIRKLEETPA